MTVKPENKKLEDDAMKLGEKRGGPPTLLVDYKKYESMLADSDLSEDQKRAFLDTLWSVIVGFVDLGFGVHPLQQCQTDASECEQHLDLSGLMAGDVVSSSKAIPKYEFSEAADGQTDDRAEKEDS